MIGLYQGLDLQKQWVSTAWVRYLKTIILIALWRLCSPLPNFINELGLRVLVSCILLQLNLLNHWIIRESLILHLLDRILLPSPALSTWKIPCRRELWIPKPYTESAREPGNIWIQTHHWVQQKCSPRSRWCYQESPSPFATSHFFYPQASTWNTSFLSFPSTSPH